MRAIDIIVTGKVQGVYFRASTKNRAIDLGLNGWCRNQKDGTVFIHVEGEDDQLQELVKWCHQGPPGSQVLGVGTIESEFSGFKEFQIKRS